MLSRFLGELSRANFNLMHAGNVHTSSSFFFPLRREVPMEKCLWRHELKTADLTRGIQTSEHFKSELYSWDNTADHGAEFWAACGAADYLIQKKHRRIVMVLTSGFGSWFVGVVPQPWTCSSETSKSPVTGSGILVVKAEVPKWVFKNMSEINKTVVPHKDIYEIAAYYKERASMPAMSQESSLISSYIQRIISCNVVGCK